MRIIQVTQDKKDRTQYLSDLSENVGNFRGGGGTPLYKPYRYLRRFGLTHPPRIPRSSPLGNLPLHAWVHSGSKRGCGSLPSNVVPVSLPVPLKTRTSTFQLEVKEPFCQWATTKSCSSVYLFFFLASGLNGETKSNYLMFTKVNFTRNRQLDSYSLFWNRRQYKRDDIINTEVAVVPTFHDLQTSRMYSRPRQETDEK